MKEKKLIIMSRVEEIINLCELNTDREALLRNAKDGVVHDLSYWIRKYKKGNWWKHYIDYWANQYPDNIMQGIAAGENREDVAMDRSWP